MELILARWQFGITTVFHFFFVPLTLGLSILVAIMETLYVRRGEETYKKMAQFWGNLFIINFVLGVVTGIVQEFQFGMNWSEYSRFVGDVFGAPLAVEALAAFFLESTFLGLWVFGWDRISKGLHLAAIWLVAFASNLSAFWILVANSFMQEPVGYALRNGRAEMTSFGALLTNPHVLYQYPHTVLAGFVTASFFVMGISAYHLLRSRSGAIAGVQPGVHGQAAAGGPADGAGLFRRSFRLGMIFGVISTILVVGVGHFQGQHLIRTQPMKMAAAEALWDSADPAPLALVAGIDEKGQRNTFELKVPYLGSLLAYNRPSGKVLGIKELQRQDSAKYGPGQYVPPVTPVFWSFRIMVAAGFLMILLALYALYLSTKGRLEKRPRFLKVLLWSIPLPYIANTTGWIMAEMGRQPWIVYGLQRVGEAVSPAVGSGAVLASLVVFTLLYGVLTVVDVYLLMRFARMDAGAAVIGKPAEAGGREVSLWN